MSLVRMAEEVSPTLDWSFVKVGPRKSERQPHVWLGCDRMEPRIVLKFAGPSGIERSAREKIERETRFYEAVGRLPRQDPIRESVPELLASGVVDDRSYLALTHCARAHGATWMEPRFERDASSLQSWLDARLRWLWELHEHTHLATLLDVPPGEVIVHGDYSHYNFLGGAGEDPLVIDWEDWHASSERSHDAIHVAVMPTIGGRPLEEALASFRRHWLDGTPWSEHAWEAIASRYGPVDRPRALVSYLDLRLATETSGASHIIELFARCRELLVGSEQT